MIKEIRNFIQEEPFKIMIHENSIYVSNYKQLKRLEENIIVLQTNHKKISISGNNLKAAKILENEILIKGEYKAIEVLDD